MRIEQEWEGYVVDIGASEFVARLLDLTAGSSHEEEEAIIPVAQVSDHDAAGLRLGSIFRRVIGYETSAVESKSGFPGSCSETFRRLRTICGKARHGHANPRVI